MKAPDRLRATGRSGHAPVTGSVPRGPAGAVHRVSRSLPVASRLCAARLGSGRVRQVLAPAGGLG